MSQKKEYKFDFIPLIKERKITRLSSLMPNLSKLDFDDSFFGDMAKNSPIDIGEGFVMSVQAGSGLYCSPRKTFDSLNDYDDFEIAIFYNDNGIIVINEDMTLLDYEIHSFEDINNDQWNKHGVYVVGGTPVAGYVPGEKIDSIIKTLNFVVLKKRSRNVLFEKTFNKFQFFSAV